jgi:Zn-dependent peptidase ImmA (M78 family)
LKRLLAIASFYLINFGLWELLKGCIGPEWDSFLVYVILFPLIIAIFGKRSDQNRKGDKYIIFYNQDEMKERVRFSILHEYGHYSLKHKMNNLGEEEYGRNEVEANCFAAQLLMPEQIINELQNRGARISKEFLMTQFGVSGEAAERRLTTMGKLNHSWRSDEEKFYDETIMFKFDTYMNSVIPKKNANNWYSDEFDRQRERDSLEYDRRTRY